MTDREKVIKEKLDEMVELTRGLSYASFMTAVENANDILELLKEQDETIKELQNAYEYLQKQFFEVQDELLKEQEAAEPIPFFTSTGEKSNNYVICGNCKSIKAIMSKHTKQKYCHECGCPVLWEGR